MTFSRSANLPPALDAEMRLPDVTGSGPLTTHRRPALPALTGLRFFAAMYVVLHHTGFEWAKRHHANALVTTFLDHGVASVALFFVLSGFILAYTYEGQIRGRTGRFLEARFARVYPVYLLSLVMSLGLAVPAEWTKRIAVLAMVQAWVPGRPDLAVLWNFPAWTLSSEVAFYLLFPWFMRVFAGRGRRMLGWALAAMVAYSVVTQSVAHQPSTEGSWSRLALLTPYPLLRIPEFFVGVLLGLVQVRSSGIRVSTVALWGSLAVLLGLLVTPGDWGLAFTIVPFTALVYALANNDSLLTRALGTRTMLFLGGASYSMYLLQAPVRSLTRMAFQGLPAGVRGMDFLASPVLLLVLSCGVFRWYEEPARRWLRGVFAKS